MAQNATMEEFEALLNESLDIDTPDEGSVVKGKVIAIEAGQAIIDVGYKMEGRVELKEFANPGEAPEIAVGDEVEVYLDRVENARGEAVISRDKARREAAWDKLEKAYADDARVEGAIFGRVKGGFTVDLGGAVAFLPGSQVDVRPVRDAGPLMGHEAAVPDPENGPPPGQHRCLAPRHPGRDPAPNSAPRSSPRSRKAMRSTAWSRTSLNTVRSLTWAALTACFTSPTWPGAV